MLFPGSRLGDRCFRRGGSALQPRARVTRWGDRGRSRFRERHKPGALCRAVGVCLSQSPPFPEYWSPSAGTGTRAKPIVRNAACGGLRVPGCGSPAEGHRLRLSTVGRVLRASPGLLVRQQRGPGRAPEQLQLGSAAGRPRLGAGLQRAQGAPARGSQGG